MSSVFRPKLADKTNVFVSYEICSLHSLIWNVFVFLQLTDLTHQMLPVFSWYIQSNEMADMIAENTELALLILERFVDLDGE